MSGDIVRVEKIVSVKPLRSVVLGRVRCSSWAWPFKVGAHDYGYRMMVNKGNRVFWRKHGGFHRA